MTAFELQLPLGEAGGKLAHRRLEHLSLVEGVDAEAVQRLTRSFRSLRAVYAAADEELARVVGPVAAARIRWFLDAPLDTALASPRCKPAEQMLHAA